MKFKSSIISILKKIRVDIVDIIKKDKLTVFFVLSNFINSILLILLSTVNLEVRSILYNLGFCLLVDSFGMLYKNKKSRNIYYIGMTIFMTAICIINSIYYNYYSSFASASLLATSVFLSDVSDTLVELVLSISDWIYLWAIIGLLILIKKDNDKNKLVHKKHKFLKTFVLSVISLVIASINLTKTDCSRFIKLWNRISVVNTFGVYVYQIDDLVQSLKPAFNNMFGYDTALKEVSDYYNSNVENNTSNEYSNIFEGKNVIVIHAESLQSFTLDLSFEGEEVTPNINKLKNSGLYFSNFYAQVGVGTSSDSEFTFASSLLPSNNGTVFVNYFNNKYVTIQNLIKDKGYYVFSMHGNVGDFWNRETMHMNMGYDKFYSKSSYEIDEEYGLGLSDKSFFHQSVAKIKEISEEIDKPYYGTLITLTNHTPWSDADSLTDYKVTKTIDIDGESVTRDYLEGTTLGNYIKSVHYMDEAIGEFIEEMDQEGLLDNTVIVIYGDHDARISKNKYEYLYNYDAVNDKLILEGEEGYYDFNDYEYELNRSVPFIIWTKDGSYKANIETPMGMIDVLPTLGNMLGIYNKYALGKDIMSISEDDGIVVFNDGSFITNKIYYNNKNSEYYTLENSIITDDYINNRLEYANKLMSISNDIITYDLLKDLE